jgi:hypothetical protein
MGHMRAIFSAFAILIATVSAPVSAQTAPVVVELYTSQGCSSCPPADALMRDLARRGDVIALSLHVDDWDYLGWEDDFASPAFTRRQRAYAAAAGKKTIYTPQVVVQGEGHAIGNRKDDVAALIARARATSRTDVALDVVRDGGQVLISAEALRAGIGPVFVQLVRYHPEQSVRILAGENAGREIVYANIVTFWRPIAQWDGEGVIHLRANVAGPEPIVVLVQEEGPGRILAAEVLR